MTKMKQKTKHIKLIKAHNNNITISDMNLKDKFAEFEHSKLDESETLLYEIKKSPKGLKDIQEDKLLKLNLE